MIFSYYLGANSASGFASLYGDFPGGNSFLHIIKGGPGNGKSGFMRRICTAAENAGLDVQCVICSGDPASLDGVYIPALGAAWADGTAPHVMDAVPFAVKSDYVNLGAYCASLDAADKAEVLRLDSAYKAEYAAAYRFINAYRDISPDFVKKTDFSVHMPETLAFSGRQGDGKVTQCFMSSVSCEGRVFLGAEIKKLCKLIYQLDCSLADAQEALASIVLQASENGADVTICRCPVDPDFMEAVLLPGISTAFVTSGYGISGAEILLQDGVSDRELISLADSTMSRAIAHLKKAKALHDTLEGIYRPYIDFAGVTELTDRVISSLF